MISRKIKYHVKNLLAISFGIVISLFILEIFLRIYNPIPTRVKGHRIVLPVNQKYETQNNTIPGLDPYIVHTKNALGFRGENLTDNFTDRLSIITVGGSTTECFYLSDGQDWPNILGKNLKQEFPNIWINNAGLDGHSTFGHQILLDDFLLKLKPKFILFLVGVNDIERKDLSSYDSAQLNNFKHPNLKLRLIEHSELLNTMYVVVKKWRARKEQIGHWYMDVNKVDTLSNSSKEIHDIVTSQKPFLSNYKSRLQRLIRTCKANNITPVFLTQPMLFGDVNDPATGKYLGNIWLRKRSSLAYWHTMEAYNAVTLNTCSQNNVTCIDLAAKMPKSTMLFYDEVHYKKAGADTLAAIVVKELLPILKNYKY